MVMVVVRWVRAPGPKPHYCSALLAAVSGTTLLRGDGGGSRAGLATRRPHELIRPPPLDGRPGAVGGGEGRGAAPSARSRARSTRLWAQPSSPSHLLSPPWGSYRGSGPGGAQTGRAPGPGGPRAGVPAPWRPQFMRLDPPSLLTQPEMPAHPRPGALWRLWGERDWAAVLSWQRLGAWRAGPL